MDLGPVNRSPSKPVPRVYLRMYVALNILWLLWLLPDTGGWQFATGLVILAGLVIAMVVSEVRHHRQQEELAKSAPEH